MLSSCLIHPWEVPYLYYNYLLAYIFVFFLNLKIRNFHQLLSSREYCKLETLLEQIQFDNDKYGSKVCEIGDETVEEDESNCS